MGTGPDCGAPLYLLDPEKRPVVGISKAGILGSVGGPLDIAEST
jgi:hypothetical protein